MTDQAKGKEGESFTDQIEAEVAEVLIPLRTGEEQTFLDFISKVEGGDSIARLALIRVLNESQPDEFLELKLLIQQNRDKIADWIASP